MEVIRTFKVCELLTNEKSNQYDWVQLIYDNYAVKPYIVIWKWTTMKEPNEVFYDSFEDAHKRYNERKHFAILCN